MKNIILYLILLTNYSLAQSGPFSYESYVSYDDHIIQAANGYLSYPNFGYRNNQGDYDGNGSVAIFYYANNRLDKKIVKPFVFVEGISFNKFNIDDQNYFYNEYFLQLANRTPESSVANIATLNQMLATGPVTNEFVGYSTFNWATLVTGIDAEGLAANNPLKIAKSPELLNKLFCAGYDIIFIDFMNGEQYIENNGEALFNALSTIKQMMVDNGSTEKMAVCGASMGGIVARYAIRKHELAGHNDWFSHFLSFDAPQEGANISLSLQYALKHLEGFPWIGTEAAKAYNKVTCPSASQLVKYSCLSSVSEPPVFFTSPSMSMERATLQLNPNMLTWPNSCKLVSITNGSRNGVSQNLLSYSNGGLIFDGEGAVEVDLHSLPVNTSTPSLLTKISILNNCPLLSTFGFGGLSKEVYVSNSLPLDNLPGSYRNDLTDLEKSMQNWLSATGLFPLPACNLLTPQDYFSNMANGTKTCFIPLLSAAGIIDFDNMVDIGLNIPLNLFQGREKFEDAQHTVSHFDVVYAPVDNQTHCEITDENIEWVISELVTKKEIVFQNEVIPNGVYLARETIKAGWDVDKYGDDCVQPFHPAMYPQYTYTLNNVQTCGPVSSASGAVVILHAGNRIELYPGFSSTNSIYFEASIMDGLGCGNGNSSGRYANQNGINGNADAGLTASLQPMLAEESKEIPIRNEEINFVLVPNPTKGWLTLKSNTSESKEIEVRDLQGRLLLQSQSNALDTPVDLSELPSGLYFVSSSGKNHRFVSKVLKE